ncbi:MAG: hypothetical protein ICV87_12720, partial [Gemmatimonadetes bacterium]|nr:hypothetical protein [Gemmatimonadota bacterium]
EEQVLSLVTRVKELQVEEAKLGEESLSAALKGATERAAFYKGVLDAGLIPSEQTNLDAMAVALAFNITAGILDAAAAIGYAVPQVGSPFAMTYGGIQLGSIVQAAAAAAKVGAQVSDFVGQRAITMAGYTRRDQD